MTIKTLKEFKQAIKQCSAVWFYGKSQGVWIKSTKKQALLIAKHIEFKDEWGNENVRLDDKNDLNIEI